MADRREFDPDDCEDCGHHQDAHDPRDYFRCSDCKIGAPCGSSTVTAAQLRRAILDGRPTARVIVEQTGGGTATLYVDPSHVDPGTDHVRAWLVLGPGQYDHGAPFASTFLLSEATLSPDDDGQTWPLFLDGPEPLRAITDYVRSAAR